MLATGSRGWRSSTMVLWRNRHCDPQHQDCRFKRGKPAPRVVHGRAAGWEGYLAHPLQKRKTQRECGALKLYPWLERTRVVWASAHEIDPRTNSRGYAIRLLSERPNRDGCTKLGRSKESLPDHRQTDPTAESRLGSPRRLSDGKHLCICALRTLRPPLSNSVCQPTSSSDYAS